MAKNLRAFVGQLWKSLQPGKKPQLHKKHKRPQIELLEDRTVPANFGTVQGFAFLDSNLNGILNTGDARLAGVKVTLVGTTTGAADNTSINVAATTDAAGSYKFTNVPGGAYKLQTALVSALGVIQGAPKTITGVTITSDGQIFSHNFRYVGGVIAGSLSLRQFTTNATAGIAYGAPGTGTAVGDNKPTVKTPIAPVSTTSSSANTVVNLAKNFADLDMTNSTVTFHITNGTTTHTIKLILFDTATPQTVMNFFNYIISDAWDNSVFHRNAKKAVGGIGVLQGGAVTVNGAGNVLTDVPISPTGSKVQNEFSTLNKNLKGTIAMAQSGGDINSATNQFFFNTVDNSAALDPQKFTVFGKVADLASMNALVALANTPTKDLTGGAFASAHPTVLANAFPLSGYTGLTGAIATATGTGGTPISITTSAAHGLATGDKVTISGVTGFAAANGSFTITVVSPTQYTLNGVNTIGSGTGGTFFSGKNFPTDAVLANYMRITDISIEKRKEFLTYSLVGVNGGGNAQFASASITNGYLTIDPVSAGTTTFTVMATDRYGASVTSTFTVTVTGNAAPVAFDGTLAANEDTPTSGTLVANDADAGNTLTFSIESQPTGATVVLNNAANGNYTFTPGLALQDLAAGTTRQVTFTFKATDNLGVSSLIKTITVTVTGINDAPIGTEEIITTDQNTPFAGALSATDVDIGSTITAFTIVGDPSEGTVVITDAVTGAFTFNPGADFKDLGVGQSRQTSFTFTATDSAGGVSAPATIDVTVTGVNDAPLAVSNSFTTNNTTPVVSVLGGSDPDTGDTIKFSVVDQPLVGSLVFNEDTGAFTYDPTGTNPGDTITFTFKTTDNDLDSPLATITINIT